MNMTNQKKYFTFASKTLVIMVSATVFMQDVAAKERIRYHINGVDRSPLREVDEQGIPVAVYRYSPFGEQLQSKKTVTIASQRGFVGGIHDQQDLVYLKHRYYNPTLGRFYQPDPVTFLNSGLGQINRYQYGWNDSYTYLDATGKETVFVYNGETVTYSVMNERKLGNPLGHNALGFTGEGLYSYANGHSAGESFTDYVLSQAKIRDSYFIVFKTEKSDEMKAISYLNGFSLTKTDPTYDLWRNNCASVTNNALSKMNISSSFIPGYNPVFPIDVYKGLLLKNSLWLLPVDIERYYVPKGATTVPAKFFEFNKK